MRLTVMKLYRAAFVLVLVLLLGWATVGHADGRGGGRGPGGAGQGFHGGRGGGSHGSPRGFQGHHRFPGHHHFDGHHGGRFPGHLNRFGGHSASGPGYIYVPPPVHIQPEATGYWYYCPSAQAYYPDVAACPERWVPVPPNR